MVGLTPSYHRSFSSVQLDYNWPFRGFHSFPYVRIFEKIFCHSEPHAPKASRARQWTPEPPFLGGDFWLVVEPTPLKNMSQNGNLLQVGVKIKKN